MPDSYQILQPAHKRAHNNARTIMRNMAGIEVAIDVKVLRVP